MSGVTVIIPHYGDPLSLDRALKSVSWQTTAVDEVIVVDDASDAIYAPMIESVLHSARARGLSVCLLKQPENLGPANARNRGWNRAHTLYLAFLDSDDIWHPEKIERQLALMQSTGAIFSGHSYSHNKEMNARSLIQGIYGFKDFLWKNRVSTPCVMVRRDVVVRFPEKQRRSEDYALWLRLVKSAPMPFLDAELARGFKAPWGEAGLSADLDAMLLGQLKTYRGLSRDGLISSWVLPVLLVWSWLRYFRRVLWSYLQ